MSINGVDRYGFVETNAVDNITPVNAAIDNKNSKTIIEKIIKRMLE